MNYLLDTNHVSKVLEWVNSIIMRINTMKNSGSRFGISTSIVGELFFAAYASKRNKENLIRKRLPRVVSKVIFCLSRVMRFKTRFPIKHFGNDKIKKVTVREKPQLACL